MDLLAWFAALIALPWVVVTTIVVLSIVAIASLEYDQPWIPGIIIVVSIAILFFAGVPVLEWARANVGTILKYGVIYVLAGAVWGVAKWYFFCLDEADEYAKLREQWKPEYEKRIQPALEGKSVNATGYLPFEGSLLDYIHNRRGSYAATFPPAAKDNKARITGWMMYWPWSALWTLIHQPLKRLYRFIYEQLLATYAAISRHVFGRFEEFQPKPAAPTNSTEGI